MTRAELIEDLMRVGRDYPNKRKLLNILSFAALREVWIESVGAPTRRTVAKSRKSGKSRKSRKSRKDHKIGRGHGRQIVQALMGGGDAQKVTLSEAAGVVSATRVGRARALWRDVKGSGRVTLAPWRRPGGDVGGILLRASARALAQGGAALAEALMTADEEHLSPGRTGHTSASYLFLVA